MPDSPSNSSDSLPPSPTPSAADDDEREEVAGGAPPWRRNLILFGLTVVSVFATSVYFETNKFEHVTRDALKNGAIFAVALLLILLAHEFGHYFAARLHKVDASLPFFIPVPILSPFGTMGAVIRMRGTIPTRKALLDIGASGPLAGLALAIPLYVWGIEHSKLVAADPDAVQLGDSLLSRVIHHYVLPPIPPGMDVFLSPVAYAAWGGMLVTMINLFPAGQLDGGHVAYALFGPRQNRIAVVVHRAMLAFFFVSLASYLARDIRGGIGLHHIGRHVGNSLFWLVWFEVLGILGTLSTQEALSDDALGVRARAGAVLGLIFVAAFGRDESSPFLWSAWFVGLAILLAMEVRGGTLKRHRLLDHPPTGATPLGFARSAVAVVTLLFFILLFMPTPMSM